MSATCESLEGFARMKGCAERWELDGSHEEHTSTSKEGGAVLRLSSPAFRPPTLRASASDPHAKRTLLPHARLRRLAGVHTQTMNVELRTTCLSACSLRARLHVTDTRSLPLVALLPAHEEFDNEAVAADKVQLRVLRFDFDQHVVLRRPPNATSSPCRALWRGFMLSADRYAHCLLYTSPSPRDS